ncbi:hypothetical protein [Paraburkholderia sp.]|uniref:hypothetical protein n=1 Tax=Paraburkholderia sp. TaxID=1926495 RepID=UPI0039E59DCA
MAYVYSIAAGSLLAGGIRSGDTVSPFMAPDNFSFMLDTLFALVPEATVRALRPRIDSEGN